VYPRFFGEASPNVIVHSPSRKTLARLPVAIESAPPAAVPAVAPARRPAPDRVLVVSLDNLGDLVFASLLTRQLRAHFPSAHITLWCKRYTADVAPLLPGVDQVEAAEPFWDRAPGGRQGSGIAFARSVMRLRARRFDVAVLAAAPWRAAAAAAATGSARRIGVAHRKNARFLTDVLPRQDPTRPVLAEMMRLLAPLGIEAPPELYYQLDPTPLAGRRARLRGMLGPRVAALHPFASLRNRCVPLPHWVRLAGALEARGYQPLWIGSPAELREVHAAGGAPSWLTMDRIGDGTIADTAAALSLAHLFVGHDSGPLHIAGALGVPVVGVFTPGEPARTCPQGIGQSHMLVRASPHGVSAADLLDAVDRLQPSLPLRLVR
jgi:ADP-heptose:LPS heptosyltransferase